MIAEIHIYDDNYKELMPPFDIKPTYDNFVPFDEAPYGYTQHFFNFMVTSIDKEMKLNINKRYEELVKEFSDEPDNAH